MSHRRNFVRTTLAALALSLMALSAPSFSADQALFNYVEEGHSALPLSTMSPAEAAKLIADFSYSEKPQRIEQDVAYALMQAKGAIVIDVREPHEYAAGHIVGAYNMPKDSIAQSADLAALKDSQTPIMVYCRSGGRAGQAMTALAEAGFSYVMNIGGVLTWPYGLTTEPTQKPFAEAVAEVKMAK